jgi:hypothetical protein
MRRQLFTVAALGIGTQLAACGANIVAGLDEPDAGAIVTNGVDASLGPDAEAGPGTVGPSPDSSLGPDSDTEDASVSAPEGAAASLPPLDASADLNARELCIVTSAQYLPAPIIPPYAAAGLDLRGGPAGNGSEGWNPADAGSFIYDPGLEGDASLTAVEAKSLLCNRPSGVTCVSLSDAGDTVTCNAFGWAGATGWGGFYTYYDGTYADPGNVWVIEMDYTETATQTNYVYSGRIEATGSNGTHYSIGLGGPVIATPRGRAPEPVVFPADAANGGPPSAETWAIVNDLYDALMAQFLPTQTPAADCFASGDCGLYTLGAGIGTAVGETGFVFVPLHLEIDVQVQGTGIGNLPANCVESILLYADSPSTSE